MKLIACIPVAIFTASLRFSASGQNGMVHTLSLLFKLKGFYSIALVTFKWAEWIGVILATAFKMNDNHSCYCKWIHSIAKGLDRSNAIYAGQPFR